MACVSSGEHKDAFAKGGIAKLKGSRPVIATPLFNGKIDFDSLLRLFDHLFPELDCYTLGGSTGELVSRSFEERRELMKFAVENTPAGKAIVVGLTHTNLQDVIALARHARDLDIRAGLLAARPFKREVRGGKSSITFFSQTES